MIQKILYVLYLNIFVLKDIIVKISGSITPFLLGKNKIYNKMFYLSLLLRMIEYFQIVDLSVLVISKYQLNRFDIFCWFAPCDII